MRSQDGVRFKHIAAQTTDAFTLVGGIYQILAVGIVGGQVQLEVLGPDDVTWLTANDCFTADGGDTVYLAPGQYRFNITVDPDVSVVVSRVPAD